MSIKKSAIVAGLTATVLSLGAFAGDDMKGAKFESLDKNSDGRITASEASAHQDLSTGFATADANADGGLTKAEFNSWSASMKSGSGSSGSMSRDSTTPGTTQSQSTTTTTETVPSDDTTTQPTP